MPKNDYFRIVYVILKELYRCKKEHESLELEQIAPTALGINEGYRDEILEEMLDEGYVKGFNVKRYINGKAIMGLEDITVTPQGIEYLQDNSKMKKVAAALKTIKEVTPGL